MLHALGGEQEDAVRRFACAPGTAASWRSSGDVLTAVSGGGCWAGITLEETALKRVDAGDSIALVYPEWAPVWVPDCAAPWCGTPHPDNARTLIWTVPPATDATVPSGRAAPPLSVRADPLRRGRPSFSLSDLTLLDYDAGAGGAGAGVPSDDLGLLSGQQGGGPAVKRLTAPSATASLPAFLARPPSCH